MTTQSERLERIKKYKMELIKNNYETDPGQIAVVILKLNAKEQEFRKLIEEEEHIRKTDSVKSFMFC